MNLSRMLASARGRRPPRHDWPDRRRQVRHHVPVAVPRHDRHASGRPRRPDAGPRPRTAERRRSGRRSRSTPRRSTRPSRPARRSSPTTPMALIDDPAHRGDHRGDRRSRRPASGMRWRRSTPASTSSWSTSRPMRWPARCSRKRAEQQGRRLLDGLGRPAGADLRARRLGAHLRLQGRRRRQGHALPPDLSPLQSRHGLGHPRQVPEHQGSQPHQPEDVQLVRRRHQVRHRDDGGLQCHRPRAADQRAVVSAGVALRACRGLQAAEPTAACSRRPA